MVEKSSIAHDKEEIKHALKWLPTCDEEYHNRTWYNCIILPAWFKMLNNKKAFTTGKNFIALALTIVLFRKIQIRQIHLRRSTT